MQTKQYKFVEKLKVAEQSASGFRLFHPITFGSGKVHLSIQASYGHYCKPRQTVNKIFYDFFEIMMDEQYAPSHWSEMYDSNGVYGYVSCEDIESLFNDLNEKYGVDETPVYI